MLRQMLAVAVMCGAMQIAYAENWTPILKFQRESYNSYESDTATMTETKLLNDRRKIYEYTAVALSKLETPDFSAFSEEAVYDAFWAVFDGYAVDKVWLKELKNRIAELSGGEVQLRGSSSIHFNVRVRGPAEYLILKKGKSKTRIILGPYVSP